MCHRIIDTEVKHSSQLKPLVAALTCFYSFNVNPVDLMEKAHALHYLRSLNVCCDNLLTAHMQHWDVPL